MTDPSLRELVVTPAIRARIQTLVAENPEVKTLSLILGEAKMREWALSLGVATDPVLESLAPPIPSREMRQLVGEAELEMFLWTGALDLDIVLAAWESHRGDLAGRRPAVLDFGCGCGRLSRFLIPCAEAAEIHATDVDPALVSWCRSNLDDVETAKNEPAPPLDYPAARFDLVYSVSVLTHHPRETIAAWLPELARVTRPGGLLVASSHGPRSQEVRSLAETAGFEVLELRPGGLRGWQDLLVARKR